jgi:hypothetical protein
VIESGGFLQITPGPFTQGGNGLGWTHGLNTGGATAATAKFSQRYGYFSVRAKEPPFGQYDGAALWLFPIGKSNFPQNPDCTTDGNEEIDFGEAYNGQLSNGQVIPIAPDPEHVSFSYHDFCFNNQFSFQFPGNIDTSADYHVYGLWWHNDGSPHGSFIPYFDGNQLSAPIQTDSRSNLWDNGAYILLNEAGQTGPSLNFDWIHVYQEQASSGTPTPTSTPTSTPTPAGCGVSIATPVFGSTVPSPVAITLNESGCGGNFNRLGSVEP